jgi:hypothetical protein
MPCWSELYLTPDARPTDPPASGSGLHLAAGADYVPLGWLALVRGADLTPRIDRVGRELLVALAPVARAREDLARRRGTLEEVLWRIDAPALFDDLDDLLAAAPAGAHLQIYTEGLLAPWRPADRSWLAPLIAGLDGRERQAWASLLAGCDASLMRTDDGRLVGNFHRGTAVNACVGQLRGRPWSTEADEDLPDIPAAYRRFGARGRGRIWRDAQQACAEQLPAAAEHAAWAEQLCEQAYDHDEGWLADQLPAHSPAQRAAVLLEMFGKHSLAADDPDPAVRRLASVCRLARGVRDGDPDVPALLADPDPRVRALLALQYGGSGDPDLDEDADGETIPAPLDHVWQALVVDPDDHVRVALLWNGRAAARPPADDPSPLVRANHPDTDQHELRRLARREDPDVLEGAFHHPNIQRSTYHAIARAILRVLPDEP